MPEDGVGGGCYEMPSSEHDCCLGNHSSSGYLPRTYTRSRQLKLHHREGRESQGATLLANEVLAVDSYWGTETMILLWG